MCSPSFLGVGSDSRVQVNGGRVLQFADLLAHLLDDVGVTVATETVTMPAKASSSGCRARPRRIACGLRR